MENIPNKIYLIVGDECPDDADFKQLSEVTWSSNRNFKNDIEYINVASLREAIEGYHKAIDSELDNNTIEKQAALESLDKVLKLIDTVNPKN